MPQTHTATEVCSSSVFDSFQHFFNVPNTATGTVMRGSKNVSKRDTLLRLQQSAIDGKRVRVPTTSGLLTSGQIQTRTPSVKRCLGECETHFSNPEDAGALAKNKRKQLISAFVATSAVRPGRAGGRTLRGGRSVRGGHRGVHRGWRSHRRPHRAALRRHARRSLRLTRAAGHGSDRQHIGLRVYRRVGQLPVPGIERAVLCRGANFRVDGGSVTTV